MCLRQGEIDVKKLFRINDVKDLVTDEYEVVERNLNRAEEILTSDREPDTDIGEQCSQPHACAYWNYCSKHLPEHNVFQIYRCNKNGNFIKTESFLSRICKNALHLTFCRQGRLILRLMTGDLMPIIDF